MKRAVILNQFPALSTFLKCLVGLLHSDYPAEWLSTEEPKEDVMSVMSTIVRLGPT